MDWFLYDNGLRHERVKSIELNITVSNSGVIFIPFRYSSFNKHNFEFGIKQTGSHATLLHVFFKDFTKILRYILLY